MQPVIVLFVLKMNPDVRLSRSCRPTVVLGTAALYSGRFT